MFYFGRIISAFFNQLFRFLFNNRLGQKILIIIIISLIAFWCLGMTKVHAVDEVEDINYEVRSYYDSVINEAILRLYYNWDNISDAWKTNFLNGSSVIYFYFGNEDGSSYNNAKPINMGALHLILFNKNWNFTNYATITNYDYLGVTGYSMYSLTRNVTNLSASGVITAGSNNVNVNVPLFVITYQNYNWVTFVNAMRNNDTETIISLLEDIKAEQQVTNDFLTDDTMDETNIDIPSPTLDTTTQDTDTSIHNSINTLTSSLQNTITNYYERLGCLRLGYTYA